MKPCWFPRGVHFINGGCSFWSGLQEDITLVESEVPIGRKRPVDPSKWNKKDQIIACKIIEKIRSKQICGKKPHTSERRSFGLEKVFKFKSIV